MAEASDLSGDWLPLDTTRIRPLDTARLRAAFDSADDAFFHLDLADKTIRWSRGVTLLFGHDPERIGPRLEQWQQLIHPDEAAAVIAAGAKLLPSSASAWSHELRFARADGSFAPVRVRAFLVRGEAGEAAYVVGSMSDLSPIRGLEEQLREQSAQLGVELARERQERIRAELLMRLPVTEVLGEWWIAEDRIVWSPNVESVLGYPASEIASPAAFAQRSPEVAQDLEEMRGHIATGTRAWARQLTWVLGSGERLRLEAQAYVLRDIDDRPERVVGSIRRLSPDEVERPVPDLTQRQRQVLALVRLGHTNKEIGTALGITEQAAKVQVSKLLRKYGVTNRAALAVAGRAQAAP